MDTTTAATVDVDGVTSAAASVVEASATRVGAGPAATTGTIAARTGETTTGMT